MKNHILFNSGIQEFAQAYSAEVQYPRMAEVMLKFGFDWEAHKVHTEDHYILTTYHVLGQTGKQRPGNDKGTVLIQHGDMEDGAFWLNQFGDSIPFHLLLAEQGYDVWIGNNRGTEYSWDHETLSSKDDAEYWNWTWADMGLYDDVANIKAIKKLTGAPKIYYIGYSQGTIQMFYGLAHLEKSFYADNLIKVVQLAPCFVPLEDPNATIQLMDSTIMRFRELGVHAINGPNWERDRQTLCDNYPSQICDYYKSITGYMGQGVESEIYWSMNGNPAVKRFQEKQADDKWLAGELETPLVPLENIKRVPIAMFIATSDQTCPYDTAKKYIPRIGSKTTQILVEGVDHDYFHSRANSQWFMDQLIAQLQPPAVNVIAQLLNERAQTLAESLSY